jgi:alpha-beta hydrolase superfamily lysophospholipase
VASLRFDLRGHGQSEGRQEKLTLATIQNDIRVALADGREAAGAARTSLLGASFGGGICAYYYGARRTEEITRLVLLNPQLDYKERTIDSRSYWLNDQLSDDAAHALAERAGIKSATPPSPGGRPCPRPIEWDSSSTSTVPEPPGCPSKTIAQ